jgi:hypothetical protein
MVSHGAGGNVSGAGKALAGHVRARDVPGANGRDSFFTSAFSNGRYRYDPGCMAARDARARQVKDYFISQLAVAATCEWTASGQVLVVDNRQALHTRASVAEGDMDQEREDVSSARMSG